MHKAVLANRACIQSVPSLDSSINSLVPSHFLFWSVALQCVCGRLPHLSKLCVHGLNSLKGSLSGTTLAYSKHAICLWQQPLLRHYANNKSILGTLTFANRWLMCAWAWTTRVNKYCFKFVNCINKQAHMKGYSIKSDTADTVPVLKNNLVTLHEQ